MLCTPAPPAPSRHLPAVGKLNDDDAEIEDTGIEDDNPETETESYFSRQNQNKANSATCKPDKLKRSTKIQPDVVHVFNVE